MHSVKEKNKYTQCHSTVLLWKRANGRCTLHWTSTGGGGGGGADILKISRLWLDAKERPENYVRNLHYLNSRCCYCSFQVRLPIESEGGQLSGQYFMVPLTAAITQIAGLWGLYFEQLMYVTFQHKIPIVHGFAIVTTPTKW